MVKKDARDVWKLRDRKVMAALNRSSPLKEIKIPSPFLILLAWLINTQNIDNHYNFYVIQARENGRTLTLWKDVDIIIR